PHHLPPFPTRRSSDLWILRQQRINRRFALIGGGGDIFQHLEIPVQRAQLLRRFVRHRPRRQGKLLLRISRRVEALRQQVHRRAQDRKSTRLNSSHVKI